MRHSVLTWDSGDLESATINVPIFGGEVFSSNRMRLFVDEKVRKEEIMQRFAALLCKSLFQLRRR